jgi:hypothetical protein
LCVSPATGAHHFPRGLLEDGAAVEWSGAKRLAARSGRLLQRSNWPLCANYPRTGRRCAAVSESSWGRRAEERACRAKQRARQRTRCCNTHSHVTLTGPGGALLQRAPCCCASAPGATFALCDGAGVRKRRDDGQSIAFIPCQRRACEHPHGTRAGVAAPAPRAWDHGLQRSPGELPCQTAESCAMPTYSSLPVPPGRDAVVARAQGRGHRTR